MTDLASFLLARLDEEEFVARAAGGNRWAMMADLDEVAVFAERKPGDETSDGKGWDVVAYWRRGDNVEGIDLRLTDIVPFADHIARHNPARVLADIEAKREIVKEHWPLPYSGGSQPISRSPRSQHEWVLCSSCGDQGYNDFCGTEYPCPTLRLLALPYAEQHPDWREEWHAGWKP